MGITQTDSRIELVRAAFWLEWLTIAWMVIEAAVALWSAYVAQSVTLLAFGLDSAIELMSAGILVWRLTVELRHGQEISERIERFASRIGGGLLFALATYVVITAAWGLWTQRAQEFSMPGLLVALVAIPTMYFLAKRKIAIAEKIGSRALRADAVESITCGWLSFMVVIGLVAQYRTGAWWIDSATSLWDRLVSRQGRNGSMGRRGMLRHLSLNVRFGSLADIEASKPDVRFTPNSGHSSA